MNSDLSDIATNGLTMAVTKDGQTTITGAFKGANGSVGLPMYSFASDTNTGMYRHGADELGFSTAGTLAGWFNSSQKFFMLGAADVADNLSVTGTGSITGVLSLLSTSHVAIPSGTSAQRPGSPAAAMFRWNSTLSVPEIYTGTTWQSLLTSSYPRGYIDGCIISNGTDATNDINIASGVCRDSTDTVNITVATMAGKQLDANWAPGANAGMRNSSAGIANTTYHIYAVAKADGTQDIYADTTTSVATAISHLQAETGGSAYLYARRIASIVRAGATILAFVQNGEQFLLVTPVLDYNVTNPGASAVTAALPSLPAGIVVDALVTVLAVGGSSIFYMLLSSLDCADVTPSSTNAMLVIYNISPFTSAGAFDIKSNTSASIRYRISASGGSDVVKIYSRGWIDARGADS